MPSYEEDAPRLAEIARNLQDFRSEFRVTVGGLLSKEVYESDKRAMQLQIDTLTRDNKNLQADIERDRADRRSLRNLAISAVLTALGSIVVAFLIG